MKNLLKHPLKIYLWVTVLIAFLFFFALDASAQVGDTGGPVTDWETGLVCRDSAGIKETLTKATLWLIGENGNDPVLTYYYNARNVRVNIATNQTLIEGSCGENGIEQAGIDTLMSITYIPRCQWYTTGDNESFISVYLLSESGTFVDSLGSFDLSGNEFDPSYTANSGVFEGWCDGASENVNVIAATTSTSFTGTSTDNLGFLSYSMTNVGLRTATITISPLNSTPSTFDLRVGSTYSCNTQINPKTGTIIYCPDFQVQPNGSPGAVFYVYRARQ